MIINIQIDKFRKAKKINGRQLAELTGFAPITISYWRRGVRKVPLEALERIAAAFGCYPSELLPDAWQKPSDRTIDDDLMYRILINLIGDLDDPEVIAAAREIGTEFTPELLAKIAVATYREELMTKTKREKFSALHALRTAKLIGLTKK